MSAEPYNYELIVQHPKLLALYSGWVAQKICFLADYAVTLNRSDHWPVAASEMDRLVLLLHCAEKAKVLKLSDETKVGLGELIGYFAAGGWWTSRDGAAERLACRQDDGQGTSDSEPASDNAPFYPCLLLEHGSVYSVAPTVINQLDTTVIQAAEAMDNLDMCRLGVAFSGFCCRSSPQLGNTFINLVFNNLAADGMTDLETENEFRRSVGLSEVSEDRCPRSLTDPVPSSLASPEDSTGDHDNRNVFAPYIEDMTDHRDLVLGCVFNRFDVPVPPVEHDAAQYPELAKLKNNNQIASVKSKESAGKLGLAEQTEFWSEEALEYLGITRRNLVRPDMALQRLIQKGALRPTKIGGRLVFKKAELDRILEKGDQAPRRGRPRKDGK